MEGDPARSTPQVHSLESVASTRGEGHSWEIFGRSISKNSVGYFTQIFVIYIMVIASLINISVGNSSQLFTALLSMCLGAVLPQPKLKMHKAQLVGSNPSVNITWVVMADRVETYMKNIYAKPSTPASFSGLEKLWTHVKSDPHRPSGITKEKLKQFLEKQETYQTHTRPPKNYPTESIIVESIGEMVDADILHLPTEKSKFNKNYKF